MSINYATLATGALGFTIALAWNDAVSKTVHSIYPPKNDASNAQASLLYALVITILVIVIVAVINHTRKLVHKAIGQPSEPAAVDAKREQMASSRDVPIGHGIIRLWTPPTFAGL